MLVLSRKVGEKTGVGEIVVTVLSASEKCVRLGFEGSKDIPIVREEVLSKPSVSEQALRRKRGTA